MRISDWSSDVCSSDLIADPEAEIGRDLIVSGTGGVQASCRRADDLRQTRFHMHVDVFKIEIFDKTARFIFSRDLIQPARNGCSVLCRHDTLLRQHRDVRFRSGDVLPPYSLVEWYGGIYQIGSA